MKPTQFFSSRCWLSAGLVALTAATASAQQRIVGGTQAQPGDYPWMVALTEKGVSAANAQFCGGALIDSEWVATAAHCVEGVTPNNTDVVIGAYDLRDPQSGQRIAITEVRVHSRYNSTSNNSEADIALLRLARPITNVSPLQLVDQSSQIAVGTQATVTGFGLTTEGGSVSPILRQVQVPIVSLAVANQVYGDLNSFHLPAGLPEGGRDSCQGDSGGPLVVQVNGNWRLAGIVSFGNGCAQPDAYGIYANVLTLRQWALNEMGRPGGENPPPTDGGGNSDGGADDEPEDDVPTTPPAGGDDHGDDYASATRVTVPSTTPGQLEAAFDYDTFKFTLASSATVTIETTGSTDTYGYLDSEAEYLAEDDNSGAQGNFRLTEELPAGTYYVVIEAFDPSSQVGSYQLRISSDAAADLPQPDAVIYDANNAVIASGGSAARFEDTTAGLSSNAKRFSIVNHGDGRLNIDGAQLQGSGAEHFRVTAQPSSEVTPGRSTTLSVVFAPDAAGDHEATLIIISNDPENPSYAVAISGTGVAPATDGGDDDHGDDITSATWVGLPDSLDGVLDNGDADVFAFELTSRQRVVLRTTGDLDTYGTLVDEDGNVVAEDDDRGSGFNFRIRRRLNAGAYFLIVEGYDEFEAGDYGLSLVLR